MVRQTGWPKGAKPHHPVSKIAGKLLRSRLKKVWYYASRATTKHDADLEYVHQLRVNSRRARAALGIFGEMISSNEVRWFNKRLQQLRRAAGEARDLDVFHERLRTASAERNDARLEPVIAKVQRQRSKVQQPLVVVYRKAKRQGFRQRIKKLEVAWQAKEPEPRFVEAAPIWLGRTVDEFLLASQADLRELHELHQLRIAGKRVRYTMELLSGAFEPGWYRDVYSTFADIQRELGQINDHATAISMIEKWQRGKESQKTGAALAELIAEESSQLNAKHEAFFARWSESQQTALNTQFAKLLHSNQAEAMSLSQ